MRTSQLLMMEAGNRVVAGVWARSRSVVGFGVGQRAFHKRVNCVFGPACDVMEAPEV
jgi:hypothetical protein